LFGVILINAGQLNGQLNGQLKLSLTKSTQVISPMIKENLAVTVE
jgi:hypothetical protein